MTGIYAIFNTLEPRTDAHGPECPPPLAALAHRCYVGKAKNIEIRWDKAHITFLMNGQHACSYLLDVFQGWLRADGTRLELLNRSPRLFKSTWLVRATVDGAPAYSFGPLEFRVMEQIPEAMLIAREGVYHAANVGGYRGSDPAKRHRRWEKWDGR